jgi:hypothetical protein
LWDLSKFQVGSQTFSGTILTAYGFNASGVLKRIRDGGFFLVLDALDEAQVRAGGQNFDAFLSDLVAALKDPRAKPTVALLARTDTADWIDLVLAEAGVPFARFQIEYFDRPRAFEFIEKQLDERRRRDGRLPVHRQQAKPYSDARNALFELIYGLFGPAGNDAWTDQRVRDFLGYAPVLEALTDYLDVSNYMHFIQELGETPREASDPWQFLNHVLSRLLTREQKKIGDAVKGKLETLAAKAGWGDWDSLYRPDEQLNRVLSHTLRLTPKVALNLPPTLEPSYQQALETSLPNHPFLSGKKFANVVFKEYAYAWGLTRASSQLAESLRDAMRHREEPFLPSQLFSRFVLKPADGERQVLDGQDFGAVYESLQSRSQRVVLSMTQVGDTLHASATLEPETEAPLDIDVLDSGTGVHFWRRLSNADIDIDGQVRLGLAEQRLALGPGVYVYCGQIVIAADDVEVDATDGVMMTAQSYMASAPNVRLRVRNDGKGKLAVVWPDVAHPWAAYRSAGRVDPLRLGETVRGDTLRKLILMFRRQRTRREDTLLGTRWSPEQIFERDRLIELALKQGVLERPDAPRPLFRLNTDYDSLVRLVDGDAVAVAAPARKFVTDYLGDEAGRLFRKGSPAKSSSTR